jgi:formylglycine-generating enzyme required for sulfatase activity
MGSPADKPGRTTREEVAKYGWPDEGPQHLVTITRGYWLFDTPCTQALWEAIMGSNRSNFQSPDRPVEQISWEDCQAFFAKINATFEDLDLTLPTEAQWEYACRAGTEAATYAGPLEILGENNAPALDPIAWYGGNSGVDFDLENGYDSSDWPNKQYNHQRAGTRPVAQKLPNPWGLYDMLGNVWEWCLDPARRYSDAATVDPVGPAEAGADRVLRGGSWGSDARSVRCAIRIARHPGYRYADVGFRPARVQQPDAQARNSAPGAEPAGPALGRRGAARPTQDQPGGAQTRKKRRRK